MKKLLAAAILLTTAGLSSSAQSVVKIPVVQNPLFEVSTNQVALAFPDGAESVELGGDLVVIGGSGRYTYRWYDTTGATLGNESTLSIPEGGTYYLDIHDTCDCLQTIEFNISTASIESTTLSQQITITPNPTTGPVEIAGFDAVQIAAVNMAGRMEALLVATDGMPIHNADFGTLARGHYIITLTDREGNISVRRLIKK